MIARHGHSLAEAVAALVAGSILLAVAAALLRLQTRIVTDSRADAAAAEGVRTTWGVLAAELRYAEPPVDVRAASAESLAIRAFRGLAVPCAQDRYFRYRGMRRPAVGKDSVVGVLSAAVAVVAESTDAADTFGEACAADDGLLLRMRTEPPSAAAEPLLVFESGAYHVAGGALRYRLGAEGRQPLTDEWLDARASGFERASGVAPVLQLTPRSRTRAAPPVEIMAFPTLNTGRARVPDR